MVEFDLRIARFVDSKDFDLVGFASTSLAGLEAQLTSVRGSGQRRVTALAHLKRHSLPICQRPLLGYPGGPPFQSHRVRSAFPVRDSNFGGFHRVVCFARRVSDTGIIRAAVGGVNPQAKKIGKSPPTPGIPGLRRSSAGLSRLLRVAAEGEVSAVWCGSRPDRERTHSVCLLVWGESERYNKCVPSACAGQAQTTFFPELSSWRCRTR